MTRKHKQSIYHANANVTLMEENVIKINGGIMINVDVNIKNIIYVKRIIFAILLHIAVKVQNI